MQKMTAAEQKTIDNQEPWTQNMHLGARLKEEADFGLVYLQITQPAGTVGLVGALSLPTDPDLLFDFEVVDILVRTESAVTTSAVTLRKGTNAFSDTIVSAANNVQTRAGQMIKAYNTFYPKSDPAGYAAAACNSLDSGGASAAARTITLVCRRL